MRSSVIEVHPGESFENLIGRTAIEQKKSLVWAIYQALDYFNAQEVAEVGQTLACHKGCDFCCRLLVSCRPVEWAEISLFIRRMDKKKRFRLNQRVTAILPAWKRWLKRHGALLSDQIETYLAWEGKPCPFLIPGGGCDIYPVRPVICRTHSSTADCATQGEAQAMSFRYPWESWANKLVRDIQEKLTQRMDVSPVHEWLRWRREGGVRRLIQGFRNHQEYQEAVAMVAARHGGKIPLRL